jgi:hypothetical protein
MVLLLAPAAPARPPSPGAVPTMRSAALAGLVPRHPGAGAEGAGAPLHPLLSLSMSLLPQPPLLLFISRPGLLPLPPRTKRIYTHSEWPCASVADERRGGGLRRCYLIPACGGGGDAWSVQSDIEAPRFVHESTRVHNQARSRRFMPLEARPGACGDIWCGFARQRFRRSFWR